MGQFCSDVTDITIDFRVHTRIQGYKAINMQGYVADPSTTNTLVLLIQATPSEAPVSRLAQVSPLFLDSAK